MSADSDEDENLDDVSLYDDDDEHPVPCLMELGLVSADKQGRLQFHIIVATPLGSDRRSQLRLAQKIENYLDHILGPGFTAEHGPPDPAKVQIRIHLHPDSHAVSVEDFNRLAPWVEEHGVSIALDRHFH